MKQLIRYLAIAPALLLATACNGQIKNTKSITVNIDGNCEMCEKTIEKAANVKKTASLDWNKDTKHATLSYDSTKTNLDEILKRVAYAGYDNEKFLAPADAYAKLPGCCKYERNRKIPEIKHASMEGSSTKADTSVAVQNNSFKSVFDSYFELKDALIKADATTAASNANSLNMLLSKIDMNKLPTDEHVVWVKVYKNLIASSESISKTKDIEMQRNQFMSLSEKMHDLIKVAKLDVPVYFQHCPMYNNGKGANWLSTENSIKNPYYGSQMLSCGKTIETIK